MPRFFWPIDPEYSSCQSKVVHMELKEKNSVLVPWDFYADPDPAF
jgi:hypothetical protein